MTLQPLKSVHNQKITRVEFVFNFELITLLIQNASYCPIVGYHLIYNELQIAIISNVFQNSVLKFMKIRYSRMKYGF